VVDVRGGAFQERGMETGIRLVCTGRHLHRGVVLSRSPFLPRQPGVCVRGTRLSETSRVCAVP
jgi:hypothetical protein